MQSLKYSSVNFYMLLHIKAVFFRKKNHQNFDFNQKIVSEFVQLLCRKYFPRITGFSWLNSFQQLFPLQDNEFVRVCLQVSIEDAKTLTFPNRQHLYHWKSSLLNHSTKILQALSEGKKALTVSSCLSVRTPPAAYKEPPQSGEWLRTVF